MSFHSATRIVTVALWLRLCAIVMGVATIAGCASFDQCCLCPKGPWFSGCPCCPHIDPTGESLFVAPGQTPSPPPIVAAPTTPPPAVPVSTPPPVPPPPGNVQAPPVYSDAPTAPSAPAPTTVAPPVVTVPAAPLSYTAPATAGVPVVAQSVAVRPSGAVPVGQDYLRITPDRLLAPVGSEVVLKAGICSANGYLLRDQRIEWLLDSNGTGSFVDVADRNQLDIFRWVWDTPRKRNNRYVIGATSGVPTVLTRGTPDPNDDIPVADGEAWVSVTSASEGTSRITAYAPSIENWQFRQASATIYWVDAAWIFPPSAVVEPGRPHVLTTTVVRRTDSSPLAGWIVRYEVGGGASLGYGGGNSVDVPTDANGRASVEVSPSGSGGGSTTVNVTIHRPPQGAPDATPQLEIGRSSAVITWAAGATTVPSTVPAPGVGPPAPPPATVPAPSLPVTPGVPSYPFTPSGTTPSPATSTPAVEPTPSQTPSSTSPPGNEYSPPPGESAGVPLLDVAVRRVGNETLAVEDYVRFDVVVTNRGDGTARKIVVRDQFEHGLSHPKAKPGEYSIEYLGMDDLAPGQSATLSLTFQIVEAGKQCHEVTVSAEGALAVSETACVTTQQPSIEVTVTGERLHVVGEEAKFRIVVRNTGDVAATDLEVVSTCDPGLTPVATEEEEGSESLADGSILNRIDRLEIGERRVFRLVTQCTAPGNNVCNHVTVKSGGREMRGAEACLEIRQQIPGSAGQDVPPAAASNLEITFAPTPNPARVGETAQILVTVSNAGQRVERQVALAVLLPDELTPIEAQIQPAGKFVRNGQELSFQSALELQPNQRLTYTIPVNPTAAGNVAVRAQVVAEGLAAPVRRESAMSVLSSSL
jgi:uncharacterized repeat protein (TIGR01451 family)